jgi:hypothetical protein
MRRIREIKGEVKHFDYQRPYGKNSPSSLDFPLNRIAIVRLEATVTVQILCYGIRKREVQKENSLT